jgi:P27 family predicted phage terminase small subunit
MGFSNSGRRPEPTALKMLRGNPGRRPLNMEEPHTPPADPSMDTPPPEITADERAAAEWARVVPMLRMSGLISQSERAALITLCQQWSRYLAAHEQVRELGMVIETGAHGRLVPNPYLGVADGALSHCHKLWHELGLTASGRARATKLQPTPADAKSSKWAGLLK